MRKRQLKGFIRPQKISFKTSTVKAQTPRLFVTLLHLRRTQPPAQGRVSSQIRQVVLFSLILKTVKDRDCTTFSCNLFHHLAILITIKNSSLELVSTIQFTAVSQPSAFNIKLRKALQRHPDRLEGSAITNCMKFNKRKCWVLQSGTGQP